MFRCALISLLTACMLKAESKPAGVVLILIEGVNWNDFRPGEAGPAGAPALTRLMQSGSVFTDFHSAPLDSPSRAAVLTGLAPLRAGVWGSHSGRHRLRPGLLTIPGHLKAAGYQTALFGTWALGDTHPSRALDHGFTHVLTHPGGTPGTAGDFLSNDGQDDLWILNGEPLQRTGASVDVVFGSALQFIEKAAGQPFFCHLAPSFPPLMPEPEIARFQAQPGVTDPARAAWLAKLDTALGDFTGELQARGVLSNTLLILTATGTAPEQTGEGNRPAVRSGRRGGLGSPFEGGHSVPLLVHWPDGGVPAATLNVMGGHTDLLPTVADLTATPLPSGTPLDGISLAPWLGRTQPVPPPPSRLLITEAQEIPVPLPWRQSCVMDGPWRLINGQELYDLRTDPGQRRNIASQHPEVRQRLETAGEAWWKQVATPPPQPVRITIGGPHDPVILTPQEWQSRSSRALSRNEIIQGIPANAPWLLDVQTEGNYDILLRRWPLTVDRQLDDSFFKATTARLRVGTHDESRPVTEGARGVSFRVTLKPGPAALQSWLTDGEKSSGAYYVEVRRATEVRAAKPAPQIIQPVKAPASPAGNQPAAADPGE